MSVRNFHTLEVGRGWLVSVERCWDRVLTQSERFTKKELSELPSSPKPVHETGQNGKEGNRGFLLKLGRRSVHEWRGSCRHPASTFTVISPPKTDILSVSLYSAFRKTADFPKQFGNNLARKETVTETRHQKKGLTRTSPVQKAST